VQEIRPLPSERGVRGVPASQLVQDGAGARVGTERVVIAAHRALELAHVGASAGERGLEVDRGRVERGEPFQNGAGPLVAAQRIRGPSYHVLRGAECVVGCRQVVLQLRDGGMAGGQPYQNVPAALAAAQRLLALTQLAQELRCPKMAPGQAPVGANRFGVGGEFLQDGAGLLEGAQRLGVLTADALQLTDTDPGVGEVGPLVGGSVRELGQQLPSSLLGAQRLGALPGEGLHGPQAVQGPRQVGLQPTSGGVGQQLLLEAAGLLEMGQRVIDVPDLVGDEGHLVVDRGRLFSHRGIAALLREELLVVLQGRLEQPLADGLQGLPLQQRVLGRPGEALVHRLLGRLEPVPGPVALLLRDRSFAPGLEPLVRDAGEPGQDGAGQRDQQPGHRRLAPAPAPQPPDLSHRPRLDRPMVQEAPQVVGQVEGAGVALARLLLQTLQADRLQVARHRRLQLSRRDRLASDDLLHRFQRTRPLERRPARQAFVEDRPQRVNVGCRADLRVAPQRLLRRHVTGRAHDGAGPRLSRPNVEALGEAEVGDLGRKVFV
jgi:hypothetical protein